MPGADERDQPAEGAAGDRSTPARPSRGRGTRKAPRNVHRPLVRSRVRLSEANEADMRRRWADGGPAANGKMFSVVEAAALTGLNHQTIRRRISDGTLPSETDHHGWLRIRGLHLRNLLQD